MALAFLNIASPSQAPNFQLIAPMNNPPQKLPSAKPISFMGGLLLMEHSMGSFRKKKAPTAVDRGRLAVWS